MFVFRLHILCFISGEDADSFSELALAITLWFVVLSRIDWPGRCKLSSREFPNGSTPTVLQIILLLCYFFLEFYRMTDPAPPSSHDLFCCCCEGWAFPAPKGNIQRYCCNVQSREPILTDIHGIILSRGGIFSMLFLLSFLFFSPAALTDSIMGALLLLLPCMQNSRFSKQTWVV